METWNIGRFRTGDEEEVLPEGMRKDSKKKTGTEETFGSSSCHRRVLERMNLKFCRDVPSVRLEK